MIEVQQSKIHSQNESQSQSQIIQNQIEIVSQNIIKPTSSFKELYLKEEMPREKLVKYGVNSLTNTELLALLLKTGTKEKNVLELSREILTTFSPLELLSINIETLSSIKGISTAKASEIIAVFELSKRIQEEVHFKESFSSSQEIYNYVKHSMQYKMCEEMRVLYLNVKNKLIKDEVVAKGSIHFVHIDVRKIVKKALDLHASSIILIHNHPSGDVEESQADVEITTQIMQACELLHIKVLDHLIVGNGDYLSFYDSGVPPFT
ncbi:MAG: DNA repair protein RadC [Nanoarchaeota archaeon]|nr:DNA repair protein RadC [Nanoarchaeota archaeon]